MTPKVKMQETQACRDSGCRIRYAANVNPHDGTGWRSFHLGDYTPDDPRRIRSVWRNAYRIARRFDRTATVHVERCRLTPDYQTLYRGHDFAITEHYP
jgi:hypothetical protein